MTEAEEWRAVAGYEGRYEVSNHGRVKSLRRAVQNGPSTVRIIKERILAASGKGRDEYAIVNLAIERRNKTFRVNVLVLESFVGPRPIGMVSCHGDGDKQNNALSNLRWDTQQANIDDKTSHGTSPLGEKNAMAKHSNVQIAKLKADLLNRAGVSYAELGRIHGMRAINVGRIDRGERWSSVEASV